MHFSKERGMADKGPQRQIQMLYSFDRLENHKLSQAYRLLVPEKIRPFSKGIVKVAQGDIN